MSDRGGQAVACLKEGLLPLWQEVMMFHGDTAYHDYEGISDDVAESERLAKDGTGTGNRTPVPRLRTLCPSR